MIWLTPVHPVFKHTYPYTLFTQGSFNSTVVWVCHWDMFGAFFTLIFHPYLLPNMLNLQVSSFSLDCDEWIVWKRAFANYAAATAAFSGLICGTACCSAIAVGVASMRAGTGRSSAAGARTHPHTPIHTHTDSQPETSCSWTRITACSLCCSHLNLSNSTHSPRPSKDWPGFSFTLTSFLNKEEPFH